jgi:hypothetical protein
VGRLHAIGIAGVRRDPQRHLLLNRYYLPERLAIERAE